MLYVLTASRVIWLRFGLIDVYFHIAGSDWKRLLIATGGKFLLKIWRAASDKSRSRQVYSMRSERATLRKSNGAGTEQIILPFVGFFNREIQKSESLVSFLAV